MLKNNKQVINISLASCREDGPRDRFGISDCQSRQQQIQLFWAKLVGEDVKTVYFF